MTFDEAYHSGCRFKRPTYKDGDNICFPEEFYWVKGTSFEIDCISSGVLFHQFNLTDINDIEDDLKANDWYLHPEDEHRMNFNNKMEEVINEN